MTTDVAFFDNGVASTMLILVPAIDLPAVFILQFHLAQPAMLSTADDLFGAGFFLRAHPGARGGPAGQATPPALEASVSSKAGKFPSPPQGLRSLKI